MLEPFQGVCSMRAENGRPLQQGLFVTHCWGKTWAEAFTGAGCGEGGGLRGYQLSPGGGPRCPLIPRPCHSLAPLIPAQLSPLLLHCSSCCLRGFALMGEIGFHKCVGMFSSRSMFHSSTVLHMQVFSDMRLTQVLLCQTMLNI